MKPRALIGLIMALLFGFGLLSTAFELVSRPTTVPSFMRDSSGGLDPFLAEKLGWLSLNLALFSIGLVLFITSRRARTETPQERGRPGKSAPTGGVVKQPEQPVHDGDASPPTQTDGPAGK